MAVGLVTGPWTTAGMKCRSLGQPERPIHSRSKFDEKTCARCFTYRSDFDPYMMFLRAPSDKVQNRNTPEHQCGEPRQESQVNRGQRYGERGPSKSESSVTMLLVSWLLHSARWPRDGTACRVCPVTALLNAESILRRTNNPLERRSQLLRGNLSEG